MKNSIIVVFAFAMLMYVASCSNNPSENKTITSDTAIAKNDTAKALYVCPMDSEVTSTHPDTCRICGMDLVKINAN